MNKVLIVASFFPFPPIDGSKRRVADIISLYQDCGFSVHLLCPEEINSGRAEHTSNDGKLVLHHYRPSLFAKANFAFLRARAYLGALLRIDSLRDYPKDAWCPRALPKRVREIEASIRPDAVQVEYAYLSRVLESSKTKLRIIDTHDIFADRWRTFRSQGSTTYWYSVTPSAEKQLLNRGSHTLAISEEDSNHFSELGLKSTVLTLDFIQKPSSIHPNGGCATEVIFVGSDNRMNREGLQWLLDNVLQDLLAKEPDFELVVYGSVANSFASQPGLRISGPFEDIAEVMSGAKFMMNSVSVGTGLPMKNLDALFRSVPVLCTPNAARGADRFIGRGVVVAETAQEYIDAALDMIRNDGRRRQQGQFAASVAADLYRESKMKLLKLLEHAD